MNHALFHKGFDYDEIDPDVIIGTNMCCQFGFERELLTKNVRADISLEEYRVDAPIGVEYFLWLPTADHTAPTQDKLTLGVATLDFLIRRKVRVYIHCKNGHGRAPTLYLAYLVSKGLSIDAAQRFLKSKRPGVHVNAVQIEGIRKYQRSLKKEAS